MYSDLSSSLFVEFLGGSEDGRIAVGGSWLEDDWPGCGVYDLSMEVSVERGFLILDGVLVRSRS